MTALRALLAEVRRRFPELVELYDNTASLQDRTVATGRVSPELVRRFAAGGYVGRAAGRAFDARRTPGYAPYDQLELELELPLLEDSDVNARVWIRIRETLQSVALIEQILERLPEGPIRVDVPASGGGEGMAVIEGFRGDVLVWLRLGADAASSAVTCAIRPGSNGRCSRRRSRATSSPTFRSATNPSTAPTRATISSHAPRQASESVPATAHRARAGAGRGGAIRTRRPG